MADSYTLPAGCYEAHWSADGFGHRASRVD